MKGTLSYSNKGAKQLDLNRQFESFCGYLVSLCSCFDSLCSQLCHFVVVLSLFVVNYVFLLSF